MTAVANTVFSAAQFNTHIRDNLNETAPAKATTASGYFVATGTNAIAQRIAATDAILSSGTTTSTTYTDLDAPAVTGPSVTVTTGPYALVIVRCAHANSGTGSARMAYDITGDHTQAAADDRGVHVLGVAGVNVGGGDATLMTTLTPGTNTFTAKYRVSAGTGSFSSRRIIVMPL